VCRDLEWVRQQWRKTAVQNFDLALAEELAKLRFVEKNLLAAWHRSRQDKVTRIEIWNTPGGERSVTQSVAYQDAEGGGSVHHDAERCGTLNHDGDRRATIDHEGEGRAAVETDDAERQPDYLWQKRETQVGRPVFLEGVLRCILRRCKLLEQVRRKEGKTGAKEEARIAWGETRETLAGPLTAEEDAALHSMHCVITTAIDWPASAPSQGDGCFVANYTAALHSMHCVINTAIDWPPSAPSQGDGCFAESCTAALHSMHCVITPACEILSSNSEIAGRIGNPSYEAFDSPPTYHELLEHLLQNGAKL